VGELYGAVKLRSALGEALGPPKAPTTWGARSERLHIRFTSFGSLRTGSAGLDRKAPWFQIKEDPAAAATSVYVTRSVRAVDNLKTPLAPILPHTAQKLHEYLGYDGELRWPSTGHAAGGRVPGRDTKPRGADVRSQRGGGGVDQECAAAGPGPARAGAALQEARRECDRGGVRAVGRIAASRASRFGDLGAGASAPAPRCL
jgi:hypothetical protein